VKNEYEGPSLLLKETVLFEGLMKASVSSHAPRGWLYFLPGGLREFVFIIIVVVVDGVRSVPRRMPCSISSKDKLNCPMRYDIARKKRSRDKAFEGTPGSIEFASMYGNRAVEPSAIKP
jgi:hypothetical protein